MSTQTSGNPVTAEQEAKRPTTRIFQMDATSPGSASDTVNLFRGDVLLPLDLVTLEDRGGLRAKVTLSYQSDVHAEVDIWNLEAPTGVVGMGWSLGADRITLDRQGSTSPYDDTYYLRSSDGSVSRLFLVERGELAWRFEPECYDFSEILYFPADERWEVRGADGLMRVYGGAHGALWRGVKWGGPKGTWTDASNRGSQSSFVVAWNLSATRNRWGDAVQFEYTALADDDPPIGGAAGLPYTRARYLRRIVMPTGRVVTFTYLPKRHDEVVREYEAPHTGPRDVPASYQDRFETRYLDSISVAGPPEDGARTTFFTVRLSYTIENFSVAPGESRYLYKRYLRAISIVDAEGEFLPGACFDYYTKADADADGGAPAPAPRGALKQVTYPRGARTTYRYAQRSVAGTSLHRRLDRSHTGDGVPRVWFGPNYVALLRFDPERLRTLTLSMLDWNGRWEHSKVLTEALPFPLDPSTIDGLVSDDVLVLWCRLRGSPEENALRVWAVRRKFGAFGEWDVTALDVPSILAGSEAQVVAGRDFVVAASSDDGTLYRHVWDRRARAWVKRNGTLQARGGLALAAGDSVYVACARDAATGMSRLSVARLDRAALSWKEARLDDVQVAWSPKEARFSWALSDSFAAATFTTRVGEEAETFDYEVRVYGWNRDLEPIGPIERFVIDGVPFGAAREATSSSAFSGSLLVNEGLLLRYNGVAWVREPLARPGSESPAIAAGEDLVAVVRGGRCRLHAYDAWSDRILPRGELDSGSARVRPSVIGRYVTAGDRVFFRGPSGELQPLDAPPGQPRALFNAGPKYLGYVDRGGRSRVILLKNGTRRAVHELAGHLFSGGAGADAGFALCGPDCFLTWWGRSFDTAEEFVVHRVLHDRIEGAIPDFVVTSVTHDAGLGPAVSHAYEYLGEGTTGPDGLASQYSAVRSVSGTDDPGSAPWGSTLSHFYDGLRRRGEAAPEGYGVLSGVLYKKEALDAAGRTVAVEQTEWEVVRSIVPRAGGAPQNLIGYQARPRQQSYTLIDVSGPSPRSLRKVANVAYDERNGQVRSRASSNRNSRKLPERVEERYVFAYERYPALIAENVLNEIVEITQLTDGVVTRREATIWTPAALPSVAAGILAPSWHGRARSADATLGPEAWTGVTPPDPTRWRASWRIDRRDRFGNVLQCRDGAGVPCTTVYDRDGRFEIASFSNAERDRGEILFAGFEAYEDLSGWKLGGSEDAFRAAIETGDAQIGTRCVRVPGAPAHDKQLTYSWDMHARGGPHVLFAWVKTPAGYPDRPPRAVWAIVADGQTRASLEIPATNGAWVQIFVTAELPEGARAMTLACDNPTADWVKVQCVRFAPALGDHRVQAHDARRLRARAAVCATGATQRQLYAAFDVPSLAIDPEEVVTGLEAPCSSRLHNELRFDPSHPDARWRIRLPGWGQYQNFVRGGDLPPGWNAGAHGRWRIEGEALVHRGGESDLARFTGTPAGRQYGVRFDVKPLGTAALQVGVIIEPGIELSWDSSALRWTLTVGGSPPLQAAPSWVRSYSWDECRLSLDAAALPPAILDDAARSGLPIGASASVTVLEAGRRWRIEDPDCHARFELVRRSDAPARIGVTTMPRRWIVATDATEVLLIADGRRVFLHDTATTPTGHFGLRARADVAFEQIAFFADTSIQLDFENADGVLIQRQDLTERGVTAHAVILDGLGRPAVTTLAALLPSDRASKLTYERSLAALDWTTLELGGLVASQNPGAGKYAYWRTRYEPSPLGRKIEEGQPGPELAIRIDGGGHTAGIRYSVHDGLLGYPEGEYYGTTVTDPDGICATLLQDRRGLEVAAFSLVDATPTYQLTAYEYDAAGNLTRIVLPNGAARTIEYDFLGQAVRERHPSEGESCTIRDAWGRVRFVRDANGQAATPPYFHFLKYDAVGRVVQEGVHLGAWDDSLAARADEPAWPPTEPRVRREYDGLSRGTTLGIGQLVETESRAHGDAFQVKERFEYDIWVQTVEKSLEYGPGGERSWAFTYSYDNLGRVAAMGYPDLRGDGGLNVEYVFDRVQRVGEVRVGQQLSLSYEFDQNARLSMQTARIGGQVVSQRRFEYAPVGWLTAIRDAPFEETIDYTEGRFPDGGGYYGGSPARISVAARPGRDRLVHRYSYDRLGRLVGEDRGGDVLRYGHDPNGNLVHLGLRTFERSAGTDRLVAAVDGGVRTGFEHDAAGNLVRKSTAGVRELSLSFDAHLGKVTRATDLSAGGPERVYDLRYARDTLAYRSVARSGSVEESFLLRGYTDELRAEVRSPSGAAIEYVVGPEGIAAYRGPDGQWRALVRDRLGSVRAAVNESGEVIGAFDYAPYGELARAAGGSAPESIRLRFAGQELEPFGLYQFAARHYDPEAGAFVSPDPKQQFPSPYTYTGGNPLRLVDPDGEEASFLAVVAIGALIGTAVGAVGGAIQGATTLATKSLSAPEGAAVFFGSVALGALTAGISGGINAGAGALVASGTVVSTLVTLAVSVAAESVLGGASSAAFAAMVREDPLDAAWKGAISGGVAATVSAGAAAIVPTWRLGAYLLRSQANRRAGTLQMSDGALAKALLFRGGVGKEMQEFKRPWVKGAFNLAGGAAAGAASAIVSSLLSRDSPDELVSATAKGGGIGLLGSLMSQGKWVAKQPEVRQGVMAMFRVPLHALGTARQRPQDAGAALLAGAYMTLTLPFLLLKHYYGG